RLFAKHEVGNIDVRLEAAENQFFREHVSRPRNGKQHRQEEHVGFHQRKNSMFSPSNSDPASASPLVSWAPFFAKRSSRSFHFSKAFAPSPRVKPGSSAPSLSCWSISPSCSSD